MNKNLIIFTLLAILTSCGGKSYFPSNIPPAKVEIIAFDSAYLAEETADIQDDSTFIAMANLCYERFADYSTLQATLNRAYGRMRYLYPDFPIPTLHLYVSGLQASVWWVDEDNIAIGADLYLGSDYPLYDYIVYDYQRYMMRPECIAGDVMSSSLFRYFPFTSSRNRLLDQMIYRGKVLYLLQQLLDQPENEIIGYTRDQWNWCRENEDIIWMLMLDRRYLFSTETLLLSSFLNDGPFCSDISQDCPARIGTWIGMQIVSSYISHNEQLTLIDLMAQDDAQYILEHSYYKP